MTKGLNSLFSAAAGSSKALKNFGMSKQLASVEQQQLIEMAVLIFLVFLSQ